ncbi:unnamed protein product [Echinostoma caproni]|uniref:Uncharacterized protein n=1 Tax=Echinostoma caproni TaxID=27848 RepID=A0A183B8D6_9TREM|nr:unnamed protein product [Echinostoma caproni]
MNFHRFGHCAQFAARVRNRLPRRCLRKIIRNLVPGLSYPLIAGFVVSNHERSLLPHTSPSASSVLTHCLQWQVDANLGITHQLFRDYEAGVMLGRKIVNELESLLELCGTASNPELEDRIVQLRSDWNELLEQMRRIEIALQSAFKTLYSSVETTFLCEPLIDCSNSNLTDPSQGVNMSSQASMQLHLIESEYHRLNELHATSVLRWSELLSQHMKKCKEES